MERFLVKAQGQLYLYHVCKDGLALSSCAQDISLRSIDPSDISFENAADFIHLGTTV
jgi:hypothetical protein